MKTRIIFISLACIAIIYSCTQQDNSAYLDEIKLHREKINKEFADTAHSPLTEEGLAHFEGLDFFPANPDWVIKARFVLNPDPEPFEMETNTARRPIYVKYGEAYFKLDGAEYVMEIYQSEKARQMEEFKEFLFLPFKDLTNGEGSYGGGRFIDLKIPEGETILIDFNKSYNPYCAYNHRYSCPVPPEVNHLNIPVPAGVKGYKDH